MKDESLETRVQRDSEPSTDVRDWRCVDRQIRALGRRRAALDLEEGRWLLAARRTAAYRHAGFASLAEYAERHLGYEPRTTLDRLRVAEALEELPRTRAALRDGALTYSAARELTRVAVPDTEREWLAWAAGKTVRDVQWQVAGRRSGDRPTDASDPDLRPRVVRLELTPEALALYREAVARVRREVDPRLTEEDVLMDMARRVLGGPADEGRAPYQVVLHECERCGSVRQEARGERVEVDAEVAERAACDAQRIPGARVSNDGSAHASTGRRPRRASQRIPPATRREVVRRAAGRCEVPGCRNATWVEVHHLDLRSEGGAHHPDRLVVLCGAHHRLHHRGFLSIEGTRATGLAYRHADGTRYGGAADPRAIEAAAEAFSALRRLGLGETEARRALARARAHVSKRCGTEELVRHALRIRAPARARAPAEPVASAVAGPGAIG